MVDVMCGTVARYLRFCGYDAAYALDRGVEADDRIATIAATEERTLVTRDRELAERVDGALLLESREPADQLTELAATGVDLELADVPTRCGRCNGRLERVSGATTGESDRPGYVPSDVVSWQCRNCGQWFWRGSHWRDVRERLRTARRTAAKNGCGSKNGNATR
nr:Mut7-C RNAse domain-containing protein [Halopenitus persicus]